MRLILGLFQRTWAHAGFRKYFKSTSWMFGGKIATMAISFIATLYIARSLGPTNFGELSYALSIIGLIGFIAPLGLDGIVYRELIKYPEKERELLGTAFILKLGAGFLTSLMAAFVAVFISTDDVSRILILILSGTFLLAPFQIISFAFLARSQPKYQTIGMVLIALVLNALKITVIALGEGVIYLASILFLESVLYAIFYTYIYHSKLQGALVRWRWDPVLALSLLKDSLPIIFLTSFTLIYARIDQVFIKHLLGAEQVGIYDAAVRLVDIWNFIPGVLGTALFPAIVNAHQTSLALFSLRVRKITLLFVAIPIVIAIFITYFAPLIVHILYGEQFLGAIPVLQIYIWSFIGMSLGIHTQAFLTIKNERVLLLLSSFIPMLVNIGLNILWIPQYGIVGAAYATVLSYSLIPVFILFRKRAARAIT